MEWRKDGGLQFGPPFLFLLYGAHGRWYNPDTGLWLSPDEKGDYFYGGGGQDAVNWAWVVRQPESCPPRQELSDCERFVEEVRRFISLAQAQGVSSNLLVMLLAEYYAGIPATWPIGPVKLAALRGVYIPGVFPQVGGFPGIRDRWPAKDLGILHGPLDSAEAQKARAEYGFKRIFFENTHHYFAVFYQEWFWGSSLSRWYNERRERVQVNLPNPKERQPYDDGVADLAVGEVVTRHVNRIRSGVQLTDPVPANALSILPDLLAEDACGTSDQSIYSNWPRPDIEKILGPSPQ